MIGARTLAVVACVAALWVTTSSCALVSGAYACSDATNCPSGDTCNASGVCVSGASSEGEGEGVPGEGEGAPGEGEGGPGEGEGEGAPGEGEGEGEGEGAGEGEGEGEGEGGGACVNVGGNHTLSNNGDVTHLNQDLGGGSACVILTGDLIIHGNFGSFPELQRVAAIGGTFEMTSTGSGTSDFADMPNLANIGGDLRIDSTQLDSFALPSLLVVAGNVDFSSNGSLSSVSLPVLDEVDGDVTFASNGSFACTDSQAIIDAIATIGGSTTNAGCP